MPSIKATAAAAATPEEPPISTTISTGSDTVQVEWSNWRYIGEHPNTYAAIPVTATPGDIIVHFGPPADDGRWEPTDAEVTRHRDNHQEG